MGTAASASSLLNFLLILILFFRQHKQDRRTQHFFHQALTKLERVEADVREVQPHLQLIPRLQPQVNNCGKHLPPATNKIAVFVDAANIETSAKQKGLKPDYQKLERELTKSATEIAGLFYYTALAANAKPSAKGIANYQVISKPIVRYQDGNAKGNLDLEIACDLITKSSEFGTAILVSGDGDFTCIVKHLQQQQKRVIVVAFGDSTKRELRKVADIFIDLNDMKYLFDRVSFPKPYPRRAA